MEEFHSNLSKLYKKINKSSCLLWSHENHITGGKKRKRDKKDNELSWVNFDTTQTGYGEIGMQSITNFFNLLQNADILIDNFICQSLITENNLIYTSKEYNINKCSYFLDIGSGFGKPIFHCAYQIGCKCVGIEVVPARAEFCWDFFYEYLDGKNFFNVKGEKTNIPYEKEPNIKYYNKKITLDFLTFKNPERIYNDMFIRQKNKEYFNDKYYYECILDYSICKNAEYIKYLVYSDINSSIFNIEENRLRFNKCFNYISRLTFNSNQKLSSLISSIITNNLSLSINNCNYIQIDVDNLLLNNNNNYNYILIDFLIYINEFITNITLGNFNVNVNIKEKNDSFSLDADVVNDDNNHNEKNNKDLLRTVLTTFKCAAFEPLFYKNISFICQDATKNKIFKDNETDQHFTHIYSYNKLMSETCLKKICSILNRTNWKILGWYSNEHQTIKAGLKNWFLIAKFPMNSTSTEKFFCYVYIKIKQ